MEVVESRKYRHYAVQKRRRQLRGSWEEDKLFIRLKFYKCNGHRSGIRDPVIWDARIKLGQIDHPVKFSHLKQQLYDKNFSDLAEQRFIIREHLKSLGVPEHKHAAMVCNIFGVVEAAVSPVGAVIASIWDLTTYRPSSAPRRMIPASSLSILGLEPVTVPDSCTSSFCDICLDDFKQQKPTTRLPCKHHFHLHCIVQWLQINHTCPYCRYPMPTQEQVQSTQEEDHLSPAVMPTQEEDQLMIVPAQEDQLCLAIDSGFVFFITHKLFKFIIFLGCLIVFCLLSL